MNERDDFSLDSASGARRERKPGTSFVNRRAKARAALIRQRVRAVAGLARAAGKVKAARKTKCPDCGNRVAKNVKFCTVCGADVTATPPVKPRTETAVKKPILPLRIAAQLIDRLAPLPFLVLVYPDWAWVVGAFHLLCEIRAGRGPGKWVCRMRAVDAGSLKPCGPMRGALRRIGVALAQVAYCRWEWVPFAVAYDLISFLFVWRDRAGRRIEDKLFGTRVIGEGRYRKLRRQCEGCGAMVSARSRFCPHCGKRPR
ncbi:MAG: zinc-ribbon domain-containing protein [Acidobacteria bacterium]|nr:zinc-ribbon domain-containing protein [Acidobacteriota bacterium]